VRGLVSAASIYGYVEQFLNAWEQRPLYKSHAARLAPVRRCRPSVADALLRDLPELFETAESFHQLDREYEPTEPSARPAKVENARLGELGPSSCGRWGGRTDSRVGARCS
jgi:hypothetical protein